MTYSAPEKIPLTIANNTSGFSAAERAAILDNAQCVRCLDCIGACGKGAVRI